MDEDRPPRRVFAYSFRCPSIVDQFVNYSIHGRIATTRADPTRVLKYCTPQDGDQVKHLEQEKKILSILGHQPRIIHLYEANERGLFLEYCPHRSIRDYYADLQETLPPVTQREK